MARPKKDSSKSVAASLQNALAFCSVAFKPIGPEFATHVVMHNQHLYAFDGVLAAGHRIDDTLTAAPHGQRLRDALNRPGTGLGLALAGDGAYLAVKLGGFACRVPCLDMTTLAPFGPDAPQVGVGPELLDAFGAVSDLASNSGQTIVEASILLEDNTVTATNRSSVVMQYWHGLPIGGKAFVLPRVFTQAAWKCGKEPTAIGWSETTFTLHYKDGAWLRSQLYAEPWPDLAPVFGDMQQDKAIALPDTFFAACEAVLPFAGDTGTLIVSTQIEAQHDAASHTVKDLSVDPPLALPGKALKHVAGRVKRVDWHTGARAVHFYGDRLRACVSRLTVPISGEQ